MRHSVHVSSYEVIFDHPQSGMVYNFGHVCLYVYMYVCMSVNNF